MDTKKQLFFSHDWQIDEYGRDNHKRVYSIVKLIQKTGYTTWFDEEDMTGNIDAAMADGIENAEAVVICITENYCKKINNSSRNLKMRDNCLKEWNYANSRNKLFIPLIMEEKMLNINNWPPGVVSMYISSLLYIKATDDNINNTVINLEKILEGYGIFKINKNYLVNRLPNQFLNLRNNRIKQPLPPININKNINNTIENTDKNDIYDIDDNSLSETARSFNSENMEIVEINTLDKKISSPKNKLPSIFNKNLLIKSKTTNFSNTKFGFSNNISPFNYGEIKKTNKNKENLQIINRRYSSYIPGNSFFSHCLPRRITI